MNIPIYKDVFIRIIVDAAEVFKKYLEENHLDVLKERKQKILNNLEKLSSTSNQGSKVTFEDNSYWENDLNIFSYTFWNIGYIPGDEKDEDIYSSIKNKNLNLASRRSPCFNCFKVHSLYFYKHIHDKYEKPKVSIAEADTYELSQVFTTLGYRPIKGDDQQRNFIPFFIDYIKKQPIPEQIIVSQVKKIRLKVKRGKTSKQQEISEWNLEELIKNFRDALSGSQWYLFFYAYPELNQLNKDENWGLARLVLSFLKDNRKKTLLHVYIDNTENEKHYDYFGETDFHSSTQKVLVMNLKTVVKDDLQEQRQLNMKFFVDGTDETTTGNFFLGQYLNYETNSGRIISGTVILQQCMDEEPVPYIFTINRNDDLNRKNDLLKEVRHIIPFFKDIKAVFRETVPLRYSYIPKLGEVISIVIPSEEEEEEEE